jgi:hypothetical protein
MSAREHRYDFREQFLEISAVLAAGKLSSDDHQDQLVISLDFWKRDLTLQFDVALLSVQHSEQDE